MPCCGAGGAGSTPHISLPPFPVFETVNKAAMAKINRKKKSQPGGEKSSLAMRQKEPALRNLFDQQKIILYCQ